MALVRSAVNPAQGYWDSWGGVFHPAQADQWSQVSPGLWTQSGNTVAPGERTFNSAAEFAQFEANKPRGHDPNSVHFNPAMAAAWLKLHPNANTPPLEGQKTGDYNPDIYRLVNGSAPGVAGTAGLGAQAVGNSPDVGQVGMAANPISLNPNGMDLAGALNLFKQYNANKSQVNIGNASKYYNPVQFHGFSLV